MLEEVLTPDVILLDAFAGDWEEAVSMAGRLLVSKGLVEEAYVQAMIRIVKEVGAYVVVGPGIRWLYSTTWLASGNSRRS